MNNILKIKDLRVQFNEDKGQLVAVDGVSIDVPKGKTVCLVGESGCGKSVTALSVMGLLSADCDAKGSVFVMGSNGEIDVLKASKNELIDLRRRDVSMIFQDPMTSLNPVYTIGAQLKEAIALYKEAAGDKEAVTEDRVVELIEKVGINNPITVMDMYPHELSGGMRQRVVIAMALASNPKLIIADEPTTALDVTIQKQILSLLNELKEKMKLSILLISHDLGVVSNMADYIYVMYLGKIIEQGECDELMKNPIHPYTRDLLKCRPDVRHPKERLYNIKGNVPAPIDLPDRCYFYDRCECSNEECKEKNPELKEVRDGHFVRCVNYENYDDVFLDKVKWDTSFDKGNIIEVRNLCKSFENKKDITGKKSIINAVSDVSFSIKKGTTLGLVGESGCGKTTVGKCILKLFDSIDGGEILFEGRDVYSLNNAQLKEFRVKAQMVFQDPYSSLSPKMKVKDIVAEGAVYHGIIKKSEAYDYAIKVMKECGLSEDCADKYPKDFSGGQRQRICIARALALRPDFLVCDEPVSALDVSIQAQILNVLRKIQKERGISILFISHDLSVVKHISDEICVIKDGKIVESGKTKEVFKNPKDEYTKKLFAAVPTVK